MQDDGLDVSNKHFYKCQKITATVGASFRASTIMLMLTWRLNYGGAVMISITVRFRLSLSCLCMHGIPIPRNLSKDKKRAVKKRAQALKIYEHMGQNLV